MFLAFFHGFFNEEVGICEGEREGRRGRGLFMVIGGRGENREKEFG